MYIAEHTIKGRKKYVLRDSRYDPDSNCWMSRDLYDLGRSPGDYIIYLGGNSFYIDEKVTEQIEEQGLTCDLCELEELFWKFIRNEIRQKLEPFYCRGLRTKRSSGKKEIMGEENVHIFDKHRLYYIRSGVEDQRRINLLPLRYFKEILNKSRDEIEQYFIQLENCLSPREYKQYTYIIFDLQRHFSGSSVRLIPQALDQNELDRKFIKDLCKLHRDELFWAGLKQEERLHEYLVRYAVKFFDYEFDGGSAWEEYLQNFINSKRFHNPPAQKVNVEMSEIVEVFGISGKELHAMNKNDLTKLYRQKAHEHHPDKGGEHDEFVRLTEAYEQLVRMKN